MARKNGLNRKEQLRCAALLTKGVPPSEIAKAFKTSEAVVKKFTKARLDAADSKAKKRAEAQGKVAQKQKKQAAILKDAIDLTKDESDFE